MRSSTWRRWSNRCHLNEVAGDDESSVWCGLCRAGRMHVPIGGLQSLNAFEAIGAFGESALHAAIRRCAASGQADALLATAKLAGRSSALRWRSRASVSAMKVQSSETYRTSDTRPRPAVNLFKSGCRTRSTIDFLLHELGAAMPAFLTHALIPSRLTGAWSARSGCFARAQLESFAAWSFMS